MFSTLSLLLLGVPRIEYESRNLRVIALVCSKMFKSVGLKEASSVVAVAFVVVLLTNVGPYRFVVSIYYIFSKVSQ